MKTICGSILVICFCHYVACTTKEDPDEINKKKKYNSKEDEHDDEGNSIRHIIEDGVKPALFGSHAYDPIKQVFELITNETGTTSMCDNDRDESRKRLLRQGVASVPASAGRTTPAAAAAKNLIESPSSSPLRSGRNNPYAPDEGSIVPMESEPMQPEQGEAMQSELM
ncbi:hypothetical protein O0L34_g14509 [Tuta absoluta]|nr:hypothetical protein O0L34_g14509 [Tuta absoluta]